MTSLIDYFVESGKITIDTATKLKLQRTKNFEPEDKILLREGVVNDVDIAKAKSELFHVPFIDLSVVAVPAEIISGVDVRRLKTFKALPFKREKDILSVAMADPFDVQAIQAIQHMYSEKTKVVVYIAPSSQIEEKLSGYIGESLIVDVTNAVVEANTDVTNLDNEETED